MSDTLVNIKGLKTYFNTEEGVVQAVDDINLEIKKGEVLGLVGESGCGKSTVALSLLRLIRNPGEIAGGEILFDGTDILTLNDDEIRKIRGAKIAMIFQDPMSSLNPVFSIGFQIEEAVLLHQKIKDDEKAMAKVIDILGKVRIPDPTKRLDHFPHEYSGGMRQRVMIAMALSCNPRLLIADEPTTSLDVTIQAQILDLMKDLQEETGSSILLITHDLGIVAEMSDRVAVMYAGKIVECAEVTTVFKKPVHPYTKLLIGAVPRLDIKQDSLETIPGEVPSLINLADQCRFAPRCSYADKICHTMDPPEVEVDSGHVVQCHFAEKFRRELDA
ncbi:MAG: ABC transporter ATP-binding protein [Candidatus Bathyarchaeota archaeon]|nr:ABC transporter ATP-binding protein [Candidatus Bathyarchaeota archaeon]